MRLTYDADADAAYIYLADSIGAGEVVKTVVCDVTLDCAAVNLDFDASRHLLGIEILGASRVIPRHLLPGMG